MPRPNKTCLIFPKNCSFCGVLYIARRKDGVCCGSEDCKRVKNSSDKLKSYRRNPSRVNDARRLGVRVFRCVECGCEMRLSRSKKYCSDVCKRQPQLRKRKAETVDKQASAFVLCLCCSKSFLSLSTNQRLCSDECAEQRQTRNSVKHDLARHNFDGEPAPEDLIELVTTIRMLKRKAKALA